MIFGLNVQPGTRTAGIVVNGGGRSRSLPKQTRVSMTVYRVIPRHNPEILLSFQRGEWFQTM